ncbi:MAG: isoprenylcysteine carboxylmethyltransferase family protein [Chloroflexota bacterium]
MTSAGTSPADSRIPALGPRGEGWVAIQFLLIGTIVLACWWTGGVWPVSLQSVMGVVGSVLLVGGLALLIVAALGLSSSFTVLPRPADHATLVTTGLYGRIRNPIYAGLMLAMVGASLGSASLVALVLCAVLAVVLDLKTRREEIFLRERFPDYQAYAARTKRFIPGIY